MLQTSPKTKEQLIYEVQKLEFNELLNNFFVWLIYNNETTHKYAIEFIGQCYLNNGYNEETKDKLIEIFSNNKNPFTTYSQKEIVSIILGTYKDEYISQSDLFISLNVCLKMNVLSNKKYTEILNENKIPLDLIPKEEIDSLTSLWE